MHKKEEIDVTAPKPQTDGGDAKDQTKEGDLGSTKRGITMWSTTIKHDDMESGKLLIEDEPLKPVDPHVNTRGK
jgi:hypothetical protein